MSTGSFVREIFSTILVSLVCLCQRYNIVSADISSSAVTKCSITQGRSTWSEHGKAITRFQDIQSFTYSACTLSNSKEVYRRPSKHKQNKVNVSRQDENSGLLLSAAIGNSTPVISFCSLDSQPVIFRRSRRNVFGKDNRIFIPPSTLAQVFPFSTVLRIGKGCTGTIIWKRHILTSAHCIHDGTKFRPPMHQQKVGFLLPDATFKWIKVKRAYLPSSWTKKRGLRQLSHDYAVLEIEKPHSRSSMWFGTYDLKQNQYVQFAGYPSDKPANEMWFSYCSVARFTKNLIINHCDAMPGMSGSGVYVYEKSRFSARGSRKIIAIFSSHVRLSNYKGNAKLEFNVATRLTRRKMRKICRWIGAGVRCERIMSEQTDRKNVAL